MTVLISWVCFFSYVTLLFYTSKKNKVIAFAFFNLFFYNLPNLVSCLYLDSFETKIIEFGIASSSTYSTFFLSLYFLISLLVIYFVFSANRMNVKSERYLPLVEMGIKFVNILIYLLVALLILHLFSSSVPLFNSSINKMNFWEVGARLPSLKVVNNQVVIFPIILGVINSYYVRFNIFSIFSKFNLAVSITIVIYLIFLGYKFGLPLLTLYSFFLPGLVLTGINKKLPWAKIAFYTIFVLSLAFYIVYKVYEEKYGADGVADMFIQRIFAMDGQVWHVAFSNYVADSLYADGHFYVELHNIFGNTEQLTGMDYLMRTFLDSAVYNHYEALGVVMTRGYPAITLISFDSLLMSIIFHLAISIPFTYTVYFLVKAIFRFDIVLVVLYYKISLLYYAFFNSGSFEKVFNLNAVVLHMLVLLIVLLRFFPSHSKRSF